MTAQILSHGIGRFTPPLRAFLWHSRSAILTVQPKYFSTSFLAYDAESPAVKALKHIPYPTAPLDESLFEPWSGEYENVDVPEVTVRDGGKEASGVDPSAVLRQLITERKFDEAEQVRIELVKMGVTITPDPVYYLAASHVLEQKALEKPAASLAEWWSLMPVAGENTRNFNSIHRLLYFKGPVDVDTIRQFALISVAKGYARRVGAPAVAYITRYASSEFSSSFLQDISAAETKYQAKEKGSKSESRSRLRENKTRWWSLAVRTLCASGRPDAALALMEKAHKYRVRLTRFTYSFLIAKLDSEKHAEAIADIKDIHKLQLDVSTTIISSTTQSLKPLPAISPARDYETNLAIAMAILKRGATSDEPAHARDIVPFFDIYKTDLRGGKETSELFSRAYRFSLPSLSIVLLAEMLHHHRRDQFPEALYAFNQHFHLAGVPRRDVKMRLWARTDYAAFMRVSDPLPVRITHTSFNMPSRMWPTKYHTALVWSSMVKMCDTLYGVEWLYSRLKYVADERHRQRWAKGVVDTRNLHIYDEDFDAEYASTTAVEIYDAAHFQAFIKAFSMFSGAQRSLQVLDDMETLGITPSSQNLTLAAGLQAKHGSPDAALQLLAELEKMHADQLMHEPTEEVPPADEDDTPWEEMIDEGLKITNNGRPIDMLVAYTTVLRGFVDRRLFDGAHEVENRLYDKLLYEPGTNPRTDDALQWLRDLENGVELPTEIIHLNDSLRMFPVARYPRTLGPTLLHGPMRGTALHDD